MALNFADLFEHAADVFGERIAVVSGERQVTYHELDERTNRLAHHLAGMGVEAEGHVGLYAALRLSKKVRDRDAEVVVVDPQPHMTYQPFLPEAAAGSVEPRHVVVPLRKVLRKCNVITGAVSRIEHARKTAIIQPAEGDAYEFGYESLSE